MTSALSGLVGALLLTGCTSGGPAAGSSSDSASAAAATPSATGPTSTPTPSTSATHKAKPVPAPSGGNVHQTVASRVVRTEPPVPLSSTAAFGDKVTVRAVQISAIKATAHGPGEIGGPAVEITLRFTNGAAYAINLGNAVVNVTDSSKAPASTIAGSPAAPVTGKLAPHKSTSGRYVFTVAESKRKPITISVSYTPAAPVVLIVGDVD